MKKEMKDFIKLTVREPVRAILPYAAIGSVPTSLLMGFIMATPLSVLIPQAIVLFGLSVAVLVYLYTE